MSNWQNPSFNLDAPEFVPKFGGPSPNQNRNMPPQQQQQQYAPPGTVPGGYPTPQMPPFNQLSPQQQQQLYRQTQYNNYQQQQFHNFNHQPYYQQPPQQMNQQPPQQNQPQPQQQQNTNNTSDKQVNQVANNLSKLTTNEVKTEAPAAANSAPAPKASNQAPAPKASNPAPAVAPEQVKIVESNESKPKLQAPEPSVVVEKSQPPSEAPIKEDEEWDDGTELKESDPVIDKGAEEVAKPKKQIVIREYKPKKEPINVIFCGHVDAGKSTIGGQIMYLTGMVDKRTLEKYEREAKEKNRESWYLSWALDTNQEERDKGKTVEVGRAFFETEKKHFIILDAPGHRGFVPNMIGGASQADIAVLVISARRGEFETGFERGGQTREHAMLVKTAGVKYLIVLVNKMDDSTVNWDQARYDDIKDKLTPYLKKCGFQPGKDTHFMPCSGFTGAFIKEPLDESVCPWYRGPCFIEYLESLPTMNRAGNGPVRMPLIDKYKDMGTVVMGKIESGMVRLNDKLCVMPNRQKVEVVNIYCEEDETDSAICGENVKLKLKGVEEEEISSGSVLCDIKETCQVARIFDAQVVILECPSIICAGFNSILHIHAATAEIQLKAILGMVDKKSGEKDMKNRPRFIKQDQIAICRFEVLNGAVLCMEPFKLFPQLGRFTLRYENKTVAVGKVLKVIE